MLSCLIEILITSCIKLCVLLFQCPIQDLTGSVETGVTFQTFLQKAALIINNNVSINRHLVA